MQITNDELEKVGLNFSTYVNHDIAPLKDYHCL